MEDILIEINNVSNKKSAIYSKVAFGLGILTIILFVTSVINIMLTSKTHRDNLGLSALLAGLIFFSMLGGLIFSVISLARKEKVRYIKTIAAIINIGMFVFIVGLMLFTLFAD